MEKEVENLASELQPSKQIYEVKELKKTNTSFFLADLSSLGESFDKDFGTSKRSSASAEGTMKRDSKKQQRCSLEEKK